MPCAMGALGRLTVSPDRLLTALKQEILRNKKKTAILGVMCLVAAYFWVPPVWGWIAPEDSEQDSLESAAPADFVVTAEPPVVAAAPDSSPPPRRRRSIPWGELLRTIQEDPRMAPAELATLPRSPFAPRNTEAPSRPMVEAAPPSQATAVERPQLARLDLELTGIVYGPGFRVATINGTQYHENDLLRVASAEVTCRVAAIRPHYVVLQFHNGTTRELRMSGARMSADDVIQVSKRGRLP
jgi:hypothetical protein